MWDARVDEANAVAGVDQNYPDELADVKCFDHTGFRHSSADDQMIHLADEVRAMKFLLENEEARGAYNLIAPTPTSNTDFMRAIARALHRPFWFHVPKFLLRLALGEMSVLITEGRYARPRRLLEDGFEFKFPRIDEALSDIFSK